MIRIALRLLAALSLAAPAGAVELTGMNLAGGEFGGLNGAYGVKYRYPTASEIQTFRDLGANIVRVPVRWERIQPERGAALDRVEMGRIDDIVAAARARGVRVIIDVHNYAKYRGVQIGDGVPPADFADLWVRLAQRYKGDDTVIFGLMNEPFNIAAVKWAAIAQRAIVALRRTGARNLVLVPGTNWSGAHSWWKGSGGSSNAEAMTGMADPADNIMFDFHQYFDGDSSGRSESCVSPNEAKRRLAVATNWLARSGARGFLSEFGVGRSPACSAVLRAVLTTMRDEPVWHGWTIWASSPWFGDYHFNLYPPTQPPQIAVMKPFLVGRAARPAAR